MSILIEIGQHLKHPRLVGLRSTCESKKIWIDDEYEAIDDQLFFTGRHEFGAITYITLNGKCQYCAKTFFLKTVEIKKVILKKNKLSANRTICVNHVACARGEEDLVSCSSEEAREYEFIGSSELSEGDHTNGTGEEPKYLFPSEDEQ